MVQLKLDQPDWILRLYSVTFVLNQFYMWSTVYTKINCFHYATTLCYVGQTIAIALTVVNVYILMILPNVHYFFTASRK